MRTPSDVSERHHRARFADELGRVADAALAYADARNGGSFNPDTSDRYLLRAVAQYNVAVKRDRAAWAKVELNRISKIENHILNG
jgi:hypothetical protein